MAQTAIQNVKILHKRYSASEWLAGKTNANNPLSLANGELGFDTTNGVLKIGTVDGSTWAQAHEVRKQKITNKYRSGETYVTVAPDTVDTWFISRIEYEKIKNDQGIDQWAYELVIYHDDFEGEVKDIIDMYVKAPDLKVTDGSATAGEGEIAVVTGIAEGDEHEIVSTKGLAVTKSYVDNKFSAAKIITVADGGTAEDDGAATVTYVSGVEQSTADHTITVKKQKLVLPSVVVGGNDTEGDYIASVSVDAQDDHKIVVTKGTLPTLTAGSGSGTGNGATVVGGISVNGHEVTGEKKTIKGDGKVISVAGTNADITISADTYTKAEIDATHKKIDDAIEALGKSMEFVGTLASDGSGTVTALPVASDDTIGNVYKVSVAGTYNSKACKVGDMFICDNSKVWRYVPSGDDIEDTWRKIQIAGGAIPDTDQFNIAAGDGVTVTSSRNGDVTTATVAHADTSNVGDLNQDGSDYASSISRRYVNGLTFDEYGHVTGYTVGTETDQVIPDQIQNASGGETAASLEFISQATLSKDDIDNIVLTTDTKKVAATDKINVAESGNIVTFKHDAISTTTAADASKDVTITAGSDQKTFTVVDSVTGDGFGHITDVKTKTVTVEVPEYVDTNTTYELSASENTTSKADINLTAGGSGTGVDKVTVAAGDGLNIRVSGDEITLSGKVAADILGMIKAHLVTAGEANAAAATLPSINNSVTDRFYQLNVKEDGTAFVQVPWKNTEYTGSNGVKLVGNDFQHVTSASDGSKAVDMYAFGTDAYGHVTGAVAVTTLDGNVD